MVAISLKLPETVVKSLKFFSGKKRISQTKIVEESLRKWFREEKNKEIELWFIKYAESMKKDVELKEEEDFLANSSIEDFYISSKQENV